MKNLIMLGAFAAILSITLVACDPPKAKTDDKIDTLSTSTKVIDTIKKDSITSKEVEQKAPVKE